MGVGDVRLTERPHQSLPLKRSSYELFRFQPRIAGRKCPLVEQAFALPDQGYNLRSYNQESTL
jgi:hypothetical protein